MTFAMSTEGDSVKSALSEANDKNATDNHTDDSSQDSVDAKETKPVENNINSEKDEKPKDESTEGESEQESETSEKKDEAEVAADAKKEEKPEESDKKPEQDKNAVKKDEAKSEGEEGDEEEGEEEEEEEEPKKEEKPAKEVKNAKKSKEKEEKAAGANDKDEDEAEDEEEEEEEDDDEEKPKKKGVPLLDQPLETSGKRERKNVQRFEEEASSKEPAKVEFENGSGTALGEIPRVDQAINRAKENDIKLLHKLLFKIQGKKDQKKNLKKFNGFAFKADSEEYKKKLESLRKNEVKHLKALCEVLDLETRGTKNDISERILNFLLEPKDSGKPLTTSTGRPKRASAVRANNRGYSSHDDYSSDERHAARSRRDKGKRANLKDDSSSDEEFKPPGDASDASDEKPRAVRSGRKRGRPKKGGSSEEEEASISGASSDESDDAPKSKRRKSITKSNSRAKPKTPGRRGRPSRAAAATPRSAAKRGRKARDVSSDEEEEEEKVDDGSSSEDEPLAKKKAKTSDPPTDEEIKTFIKSVLEGANLEEITMKTVCQRVYDNYPDFDLTARKNFIKTTVKSLIST